MDLKTPASGELARNDWGNIDLLQPHVQVKFVICDRADYDWARLQVDRFSLCERVSDVLFSPSFGQQDAKELAEWILEDRLRVRFQLQLHKLLWNDAAGH
jgi:7-carboxy-7-deazaguanine synthase